MFVETNMKVSIQAIDASKKPIFDFVGPTITIGRDASCDLPMPGTTSVSGRHAQITLTAEGAFLADLQSTNGTFLNDRRVDGRKTLRRGDYFRLGQTGPAFQVVELDLREAPGRQVRATVPEAAASHARGGSADVAEMVVQAEGNAPLLPGLVKSPIDQKQDPPQAAAKPAAPQTSTRLMMVRLASRQNKLWILFGIGGVAALLAVTSALIFLNVKSQRQIGEEICRQTVPATTWIRGESEGTGSLIDRKRKLVVTAYHVVGKNPHADVFFPAFDASGIIIGDRAHYKNVKAIKAKVTEADPVLDLALLELESIPDSIPEVRLAAATSKKGAQIYTVGNAASSDGLWGSASGTVRNVLFKSRKMQNGQEVKALMIEMTIPINSGDSGGPVVNNQGELVGINSSVNFDPDIHLLSDAIDVSEVRKLLERFNNHQ
jgi:S1-C subfamily serine protease